MRAEQHTALAWLVPLVATVLRADPIREALAEVLAGAAPAQSERPALLTSDELAESLKVSRSKLDELVRSGLPHLRVGATRRFEFERVLAYLREQSDQEAA